MKVLILLALAALASAAPSHKIEPSLRQKLSANDADTFNLLLWFNGNAQVLSSIKTRSFATRGAKITQMRSELMSHAETSQHEVLAFLRTKSLTKVQSLWINNQLYVRGASASLVQQLADFDQVTKVVEEKVRHVVNPMPENPVLVQGDSHIMAGWNVELINAHLVWEQLNITGNTVRVGSIDTGIRSTHVALDDGFAGENAWRDPYANSETHNDQNGHGTHTMGTIAGRAAGIGVAPGAKWMSCKGCDTASCTDIALLDCGQWTACPTAPDGVSNPDCSLAPVLSSNSWGSTVTDPFYNEVIDAWHVAGIIPVFANGNSGPNCNTTGSPADYKVIAVGSTTNAGGLSTFSSKGPTASGEIRPHISAPGTDIYSSWYLGPNSYNTISGTSMACPHISGVIALMFEADPTLTFEDVTRHLYATTNQDLTPGFRTCGDIEQTKFPNNAFGWGQVDALAVVESVLAAKNLTRTH